MRQLHMLFDADKDGKASLKEIIAIHKRMRMETMYKDVENIDIYGMDSDKDGQVTFDEMKLFHTNFDEDGNKVFDLDDHLPHIKQLEELKFAAADRNKDGALSSEELLIFMNPSLD